MKTSNKQTSDLLRVAAWLEAGNLLPKRAAASDNDGGVR
jgi:hypothetical protein